MMNLRIQKGQQHLKLLPFLFVLLLERYRLNAAAYFSVADFICCKSDFT